MDGRGSCPESKQISSLFSKRQAGSKIWYQAVASIFSKSLLRIFSKSSLVVWLLGWTWQLSRVQTNFFSFLKKAGRRQNLVSGSCLDFLQISSKDLLEELFGGLAPWMDVAVVQSPNKFLLFSQKGRQAAKSGIRQLPRFSLDLF